MHGAGACADGCRGRSQQPWRHTSTKQARERADLAPLAWLQHGHQLEVVAAATAAGTHSANSMLRWPFAPGTPMPGASAHMRAQLHQTHPLLISPLHSGQGSWSSTSFFAQPVPAGQTKRPAPAALVASQLAPQAAALCPCPVAPAGYMCASAAQRPATAACWCCCATTAAVLTQQRQVLAGPTLTKDVVAACCHSLCHGHQLITTRIAQKLLRLSSHGTCCAALLSGTWVHPAAAEKER